MCESDQLLTYLFKSPFISTIGSGKYMKKLMMSPLLIQLIMLTKANIVSISENKKKSDSNP